MNFNMNFNKLNESMFMSYSYISTHTQHQKELLEFEHQKVLDHINTKLYKYILSQLNMITKRKRLDLQTICE